MRNHLCLLIITIFCLFGTTINTDAEFRLENWKTVSSLLNVTTASVDSKGRIWAGTSGGVFVCDSGTGEIIREFRNINALSSLRVSVVRCDTADKMVYIGSEEGYIDIIDESFQWQPSIWDIKKSEYTSKKINDILFYDSVAYVAGDFGITLLSKDKKEKTFLYTVTKLGNNPDNTPVNKLLIYNGNIWAGTSKGAARANIQKDIGDWRAWTNYTLPANNLCTDLIIYHNDLYLVQSQSDSYDRILKYDNDTLMTILTTADYDNINGISVYKDSLIFSTFYGIFRVGGRSVHFKGGNDRFNGHIVIGKGENEKIVGFLKDANLNNMSPTVGGAGLGFVGQDTVLMRIMPNSPNSNEFTRMTVDTKGRLWTITDVGVFKFLMVRDNGKWSSIITSNYPSLSKNPGAYRVTASPTGEVAVSSWGGGLLIISDSSNTYKFTYIDNTNSPMVSALASGDYFITGDTRYDNHNSMWIVNYGVDVITGPILISRTIDGKYNAYPVRATVDSKKFVSQAIDFNGTKWLGSYYGGLGLYFFNEMNTPDDPSDDIYGIISNSSPSPIPDNDISSLVVDKSGVVGIGTTKGLGFIPFPSSAIKKTKVSVQKSKVSVLQTQVINDIMVDALNYKWIATNSGVWVISPDWMDSVAYLNTKNSPILSDEILSLATDEKTGTVFIGTRNGISEVQSLSITPNQSFDITAYPQPFNPDKDPVLYFEGLAADADIRILTLNGELVRAIPASGRRMVWDGLDEKGERVSSGVYVVVANSTTAGATGLAKIAVIRK